MTILIAALAACGVLLILWTIFEALLMPLPKDDTYLLVYLRGDAGRVEQHMRACDWLRERRGVRGRVLFVDDGLDAEARHAAERFVAQESALYLCGRGEEYTILESWKRGAGDP